MLDEKELREFVLGYTRGDIPDYQMSALAMAIFFRGMTAEETTALTRVMMESGDLLDTSAISRPKIDKHSTGGVGDKISLIVAPLAACCGLAVPMIAGRGLGITGGTLDKLESIPGYNAALDEKDLLRVVDTCGCAISGQTVGIAPADGKLYALRDVTGTVPSIPLIVASIMSKKLAAGLDGLVLDVKCGSGAFMKTEEDARALGSALVATGRCMGKPTAALVTDMEQPLGRSAGNSLEVIEVVETLAGNGPDDVTDLSVAICARMLRFANPSTDETAAAADLRKRLASGEALVKFAEMVELQGGDPSVLGPPTKLTVGTVKVPVPSPSAGLVSRVDANAVGRACLVLGAGRTKTSDNIDHTVGVAGIRKIGEQVESREPLATVYAADSRVVDEAVSLVRDAIDVSPDPVEPRRLILGDM